MNDSLTEYCDGCEKETYAYLPDPNGERLCCNQCGRTVSL